MSFASQYSYDSFSSSGHDDDLADKFVESFVKSDSYPMDLVFPREPDYQLKECKDELDANEEDLFGDENDVNFVEVREREQSKQLRSDHSYSAGASKLTIDRVSHQVRHASIRAGRARDQL